MHTRRKFMGQMLGGATALAARRGWASARILGANGRVRFGLIGAGGRGTEILEVALKCANVECVAVADVYTRRLDKARALVPAAKTVSDFRPLLDDKSTYGGWMRAIPADCDPAHVDWAAFQGEASPHDFSGDRVVNWRFYWDYSGGNVFENMVHQVGFWYKVFGLKPPARATMSGANLLSPNMQVPDMMDVSLEQPEGIFFTWNSGFGNRFLGEGYDLALGNQGTILRNDERGEVRYVPEGKRKHEPTPAASGKTPSETPDIVGAGDDTLPHMQNFFDCVRSRQEPNCPFEIGYRSAIACQMAITSLRLGRTVVWDAEREEIV